MSPLAVETRALGKRFGSVWALQDCTLDRTTRARHRPGGGEWSGQDHLAPLACLPRAAIDRLSVRAGRDPGRVGGASFPSGLSGAGRAPLPAAECRRPHRCRRACQPSLGRPGGPAQARSARCPGRPSGTDPLGRPTRSGRPRFGAGQAARAAVARRACGLPRSPGAPRVPEVTERGGCRERHVRDRVVPSPPRPRACVRPSDLPERLAGGALRGHRGSPRLSTVHWSDRAETCERSSLGSVSFVRCRRNGKPGSSYAPRARSSTRRGTSARWAWRTWSWPTWRARPLGRGRNPDWPRSPDERLGLAAAPQSSLVRAWRACPLRRPASRDRHRDGERVPLRLGFVPGVPELRGPGRSTVPWRRCDSGPGRPHARGPAAARAVLGRSVVVEGVRGRHAQLGLDARRESAPMVARQHRMGAARRHTVGSRPDDARQLLALPRERALLTIPGFRCARRRAGGLCDLRRVARHRGRLGGPASPPEPGGHARPLRGSTRPRRGVSPPALHVPLHEAVPASGVVLFTTGRGSSRRAS